MPMNLSQLVAVGLAFAPALSGQTLTHEFTVGSIDGPTAFGGITSVEVAPNGDIYVLDRVEFTIRSFDISGQALAEFGAEGAGPGEFTRPSRMIVNGDSVIVMDPALGRATFFDLEGNLLSTESTNLEFGEALSRAVPLRGKRWLITPVGIMGSEHHEAPPLYLISHGPSRRDTLESYRTSAVMFKLEGERFLPYMSSGLGTGGKWRTSGDSLASFVDAVSGVWREYSFRGETVERVAEIDLHLPLQPVTDDDRVGIEERLLSDLREMGQNIRPGQLELTLPEYRSVVSAIFYGHDGALWVRLHGDLAPDDRERWRIFDRDGSHTEVTMPVGFTPRATFQDRVIGVYRDEFDVTYLRVYSAPLLER